MCGLSPICQTSPTPILTPSAHREVHVTPAFKALLLQFVAILFTTVLADLSTFHTRNEVFHYPPAAPGSPLCRE
jgi:hypothetical protein